MISWIKNWFERRRTASAQQDVAPPDTRIGRGIAPDLLPDQDRTVPPPKTKRKRYGVAEDEPTEELLVLTEDAMKKLDAEGFDPYNTE
ncbi:MAG: hypothetical protein AAGL69_13630 [Pseudomonadota bacterium]